jgi:hypothetical protein
VQVCSTGDLSHWSRALFQKVDAAGCHTYLDLILKQWGGVLDDDALVCYPACAKKHMCVWVLMRGPAGVTCWSSTEEALVRLPARGDVSGGLPYPLDVDPQSPP